MASMLELMREYKHLAAQKRNGGQLTEDLERRLAELKDILAAHRASMADSGPAPRAEPPAPVNGHRLATPPSRPVPRATSRERPPAGAPASAARGATSAPPAPPPRPDDAPPSRPRPSAVVRAAPEWAWLRALVDRIPPARRRAVSVSTVTALLVLAFASSSAFGASLSSLLPALATVAGLTWLVVYPALLAAFELAARRSQANRTEVDFRVTVRAPEPALAVLALLGALLWLMLSGYATQGLGPVVGYLLSMLFGLGAVGLAAVLVARPVAAQKARARAFGQYLAGGLHHLGRNNTKRARKLFDRAIDAARDAEEAAQAREQLAKAVNTEAEELEQRGLHEQARALRARFSPEARRRSGAASPTTRAEPPGGAVALGPPSPPQLLRPEDLRVVPAIAGPDLGTGDVGARARALERKGRAREALEALVADGQPVPIPLAKEAAKEYAAQGPLRSAHTIYEAIGDPQIPEFYRALAVEIVRAGEGAPDPSECAGVCEILSSLGEAEAAARLAVHGARSSAGAPPERRALARRAHTICAQAGLAVPAELLEVLDRYEEAARGYEKDGRAEEAVRCLRAAADRALATGRRSEAAGVIRRLLRVDDELSDAHLEALVEELLEGDDKGELALEALERYRRKNPEDPKVLRRLFEIYLARGKVERALSELERLAQQTSSDPKLVDDYQAIVRRYPDHGPARARYAKLLLRLGRAAEAAPEVEWLFDSPLRAEAPEDLGALVDALYEWGHADPELRLRDAHLRHEQGQTEEAIERVERYVEGGGKDPAASELIELLMAPRLTTPSGGPAYPALLRLARVHLRAGNPSDALRYLEVVRGSREHQAQAEILQARAELMASNPRRAIALLREAIDRRRPEDAPEHYFELARAYEAVGDTGQARKIDEALERVAPGFAAEYRFERPELERADTRFEPAAVEVGEFGDLGVADDTVAEAAPAGDGDEATSEAEDLASVLAPRYTLVKRIGSGGMGDVHLAEDQALGRPVAVKVLRRTLATDLFIAKFRDEARVVARLSHPGIVGVYDIGQRGDWSYIVMEYVAGPDLATLLRASFPPVRAELVELVAQVADAMAYAHDQGVVHRDLKPANILVSRHRIAKVTDFGIARILQDQDEETAFSAAGLQVGTVNYMAPEQISGRAVDARTDVYLLGTTLYYALTGSYPFTGEQVLIKKLREAPTPLRAHIPDASSELEQVVMRCLAPRPDARFATMQALATALRALPDAELPTAAAAQPER